MIKKKEKNEMKKVFTENTEYVKNGKKTLQMSGKTSLESYSRQRLILKQGEKTKVVIPINSFFGKIRNGKGHVSQNLEYEAVAGALENSYRHTEKGINRKLSKETVRQRLLERGEQAKNLEKTTKYSNSVSEKDVKDAVDQHSTYKNSQGGRIRSILGTIFQWRRMYVLADGVGVQGQGKKWQGSKECKVAAILAQKGENIKNIANFCTWERVTGFKNYLEWCLLGVYSLIGEIVIISDGAKWIRNLRKKIPLLNKAVWVLDWFHVKDRLTKLFLLFKIEEKSEEAQIILNLMWFGKLEEAVCKLEQLSLAKKNDELKKQQREKRQKTINYFLNQREGIVNYHGYQMKGYLVGSGFVEKLNDTLIKKRMVNQKRMKWSKEGGEAMMQLLVAKLNGRLIEAFI